MIISISKTKQFKIFITETQDKLLAEKKRQNQRRSMHIQKMILENKIASTVPIFDLLAFKHSTEQHMLLLNSMNVLQNLKYYHDGLVFEIFC